VFGLSDHEKADLFELLKGGFVIEVHVEAGNAFEFIECAPGNAKAGPGNHRHPHFVALSSGASMSEDYRLRRRLSACRSSVANGLDASKRLRCASSHWSNAVSLRVSFRERKPP